MNRSLRIAAPPATLATLLTLALTPPALPQDASGSLIARALNRPQPDRRLRDAEAVPLSASLSLFAVPQPEPRQFHEHDLLQVIVFETSRAKSEHQLELDKAWLAGIGGEFQWPGQFEQRFEAEMLIRNAFGGDGEYERKDDFSTRISVEIIEILPNGNLVIEGQTIVKNDDERQDIRLTGICRPEDVTSDNSIISNQIHDLRVEKMNTGELKKTNTRNIFAKFLDFLFVW